SALLPAVLFRQAENAYLTASGAAVDLKLPDRQRELARLFGEAIKKYEPLIERYPKEECSHAARQNLAASFHQLGQFDSAISVLESIPEVERTGELAGVSYLLADCLARTLPESVDDATSGARMLQRAERAARLLDSFLASGTKRPEAPDALIKLGYCYRRM